MVDPSLVPKTSRIDPNALSHHLRRLAAQPTPPWLHGEIAQRMADKLALLRTAPTQWLDWSSALGAGVTHLEKRYPHAQGRIVEPHAHLLATPALAASGWRRWFAPAAPRAWPAQLSSEVLPAGQAQLLWSNMALHGVDDVAATLKQWRSAMAPEGMVMFSCLGPDTVRELRAIYQEAGWGPPGVRFIDMHDLGDALLHSGFVEPVMDMETLRLTWADAKAMLAELRQLGGNGAPERFPGLRTPAWRRRLEARIQQTAQADQRPGLTFEIIYGHALVPKALESGAVLASISEESLRQVLRQRADGS